MLEGQELEKAIKVMLDRLRAVNTWYIKKIASQIKKIGELSQSSINRLVAMSEMYANINDINEQLRIATGANIKTLRKIYEKALAETYTDPRFKAYLAAEPDALRPEAEKRIEQYVQGVYRQTAGAMINLSNTTAITPMYADAIDKAILAASTGVGSYTEAMRDTIRNIGQAGMQVVYESGYHRRLDTAVRQNIVDGVNQINKNASIMIGEELGYDAIEISAHARSAPDHEPVQGHVFMKAEWEKLQAGLVSRDIDGRVFAGFRRPIGEWNCRHTPMSFSTKWSKRKWTDEQLRKFIDENRQGCEIDGKHRTLYEAMQMMREIETAVRREKDTAVAAQAAGDDALRQQCQRNINALVRRYAEIAKASGNAEKRQRMTVQGFKSVKVKGNSQNVLTSETKNDMMKSEKMASPSNQDKIKWLPKGEELSSETRGELVQYASERGIVLNGLKRTDVDPELIKETIDTAAGMLKKYPELNSNPNLPFTIKVVNGMDANDFAMTTMRHDINVIQLNANAFRDKAKLAEEYEKLVKEKWFPQGTTYRSIVIHEIGHMYQRYAKIDTSIITKEILPNMSVDDIEQYLYENLSRYSVGGETIFGEIVAEVFNAFYGSSIPNQFAEEFMSYIRRG